MTRYSDDDDDRSLLHKAAWDRDPEALRRLLSQGVDPSLPDPREEEHGKTPLHHLCLGYSYDEEDKKRSAICFELLYDEGTEADETRYDSLIADITRKVAEMASLKGPRASVTATRLSKALDPDSENYSEEDSDDYTACS